MMLLSRGAILGGAGMLSLPIVKSAVSDGVATDCVAGAASCAPV